MPLNITQFAFSGRLVIVGFGSIGQGVLPLLLRHFAITPQQITVVTAEERGHVEADHYGVAFIREPLTRENYVSVLEPLLGRGDFLLNVSVDVSSVALIAFCHRVGALYLDTCIEPWAGGYTDATLSPAARTNYALRESALAVRRSLGAGPTAVITHGANPGLVSHFVKRALLQLARDTGVDAAAPATRAQWAALSYRLGVKVIHIAERDTQVATTPKQVGQFVNTWSIDGFVGEGCQPAELGWGSHEKEWPADGHPYLTGDKVGLWLSRPGAATQVRSWTPLEGPYRGFLITHGEAISIADYYSITEGDRLIYRPTCHYAYHPCDDAVLSLHEFAGKNWRLQPEKRLLVDEVAAGTDELGVLLMGHSRNIYWYGSRLSIGQARALAPYNNATSLQVTASILAAMVWATENPERGVIEPEEMDFERILEICAPYLGEVVGIYGDWTPLQDRGRLFPEDIDSEDPWQFKNFRVV
ncbi:MAG: saccharopine dehydrogenase C-terminal domain-containing protein [Azospirillaceae bacterium]|nr:saccharopine dehydrogenase C-terminal domain-containing protein [Azospirillaceae bacterium]